MKRTIAALLIFVGSTAFAHPTHPNCSDLVKNTEGIVTLRPLRYATNPVQGVANVVFSAAVEGATTVECAADVAVIGGHVVIFGIEGTLHAARCVVEGAAFLVGDILRTIF